MLIVHLIWIFHIVSISIAVLALVPLDSIKEFVIIAFFVHLDGAFCTTQFLWLTIFVGKVRMSDNYTARWFVIDDHFFTAHNDSIGQAVPRWMFA